MSTIKTNAIETVAGDKTVAVVDLLAATDYATDTTAGVIKLVVIGNDGYITTDGSTPGP